MQNAGVLNHIREAADNVLGTMFMSPVMEDPQVQVAGWVDPIIVGLDFQGAGSHGKCALVTQESTARALSATFLCEEGDLDRRSAWEVMCELANMFCGRFLAHLDSSRSFRLSPPRSLVPGEIGHMRPLHRSVLHTAHGQLLFLVELADDNLPLKSQD